MKGDYIDCNLEKDGECSVGNEGAFMKNVTPVLQHIEVEEKGEKQAIKNPNYLCSQGFSLVARTGVEPVTSGL